MSQKSDKISSLYVSKCPNNSIFYTLKALLGKSQFNFFFLVF